MNSMKKNKQRRFMDGAEITPVCTLRELMGKQAGVREMYGNLEQLIDLINDNNEPAENLLRLLILIQRAPDVDTRYLLLDVVIRYALIRTQYVDGLMSEIGLETGDPLTCLMEAK